MRIDVGPAQRSALVATPFLPLDHFSVSAFLVKPSWYSRL
jgi:hypothetical protein